MDQKENKKQPETQQETQQEKGKTWAVEDLKRLYDYLMNH